ncbi:hypothetical protein [Actinocrispum sp. NPDC049592]|uniref:hypothetical protein n=1 Tax=Actinocrispum sp. NPDC049592 TaxID=3154835 RepID=UPI003433A971
MAPDRGGYRLTPTEDESDLLRFVGLIGNVRQAGEAGEVYQALACWRGDRV